MIRLIYNAINFVEAISKNRQAQEGIALTQKIEKKLSDNSYEYDQTRRTFLHTSLFGGVSLLAFLLGILIKWIMKQTEELRRKQKQDRYKASPIYPYKKD